MYKHQSVHQCCYVVLLSRLGKDDAVVTREMKLFQNYSRSLLQLISNTFNFAETILKYSSAEIILFQFQTRLAYV